jgi:septum formation protein
VGKKIRLQPKHKIILSSSSPRRQRLFRVLLKNFGLKFQIIPHNITEYIPENVKNYTNYAKKLARLKASAVSNREKGVIVGADTIVVQEGKILGKPRNREHARKILRRLSGKWHKVYTGIFITNNVEGKVFSACEVTKVKFRKLSEAEIDFYVKSKSPLDKAGAYGIQDDFGSTFVEKIIGDYFNVVGLPVLKTYLGVKKVFGLKI